MAKNPILKMQQIQTSSVVKTPLFQTEECSCLHFAINPTFFNMVTTFKCPIHGEVTLDRRPPMFTLPVSNSLKSGNVPGWGTPQPTWPQPGVTGPSFVVNAANTKG